MRRLNALRDYRATLVILALCGYRQEHGQLPERLDALAGTYFETVPRDPYSARSFGYRPRGVPDAKSLHVYNVTSYQPFVWGTGSGGVCIVQEGVTQSGPGGKPVPRYILVGQEGRWAGWPRAYPIDSLQKKAD